MNRAPLPPPPATAPERSARVAGQRRVVVDVLTGADDRLLVVAGPCSVHDHQSTMEYVAGLAALARRHADDLYVVARVYPEKPRTRLGWPGMLLDPHMDGSHHVTDGIAAARELMCAVVDAGVPVATEFVEPLLTGYVADLVAWAAIGARTVESPSHRRLASGLGLPVGFKNRTDGAVQPAIDAIDAAATPQPVFGLAASGRPQWWVSEGNPHCHLILRGGDRSTNHDPDSVADALRALADRRPTPRLVVDCSHGNSRKDHRRQPEAAESVAAQVADGQAGIAGVMLESFLHEGNQPHSSTPRPGLSVTDACLSLEQTAPVLAGLAAAVRHRRHSAAGLLGVS
ncbi:3-deoxy-D-arabinoheptulosonate-7-phosphate synthase [Stackebrandtia albiflava]|uniref:Phospho-2-dehydro-3-deoxyheptonate aldolase n=1 Tax=Stackebrandtia albiflava TaxID=406432 RepID=A0A562VBF9_9ACTN|nr:3-deoxy-7-phosphoheptulonate synthase [Stackebrandtia albiflava]TWJ15209.1 3-deoxy-D-arabinoheptulosonate-7-phosphate synthase [Stackebrandtia albiflava]